MGGKGDAHFRAPKKPKQKENETKRNEKRVKDALPRQKLSVAKQSSVKATNGMAKARTTTAQQQHVNDNVVALREAPTETSGWERGGGYGRGDPQNR